MGIFGGGFLGQMLNGHPMAAFGNDSNLAKAIDGRPMAALGFGGGGGGHSSSVAPIAAPAMGPATVPSANGFTPAVPNLNNVAQSPAASNPLLPQANAPIAAANQSAASNPLSPNDGASPVMAQIQHPEFQNFISSVMSNVNQSNQPGVS